MFRKLDIRLLVIVFILLLVTTVIVKLVDKNKGDRTLKNVLVELNADEVDVIHLFPKILQGKEVLFFKQGKEWMVSSGGQQYRADTTMVKDVIRMFEKLEPLRMAATKKDRWESFEVTDSLATRVVFEKDGYELAEIYVGKFSYRQPKANAPQTNPYGKPQGTMNTYVRVAGENEVYAVNGFLGMGINREMQEFRDRNIINKNTAQFTKLVFNYPSDSSFTLIKQEGKWLVDGIMADSASVVDFLKPLGKLQSIQYTDLDLASVTHSVRIEGEEMDPIEIIANINDDRLLVSSSANPNTHFLEKADGNVKSKLFVGKSIFLK